MDGRKVHNRQPLFTGEAALPPNKSRLEDQPTGALPEMRTGLPELDYRTHGLPRSSLIVIAGRPGMG